MKALKFRIWASRLVELFVEPCDLRHMRTSPDLLNQLSPPDGGFEIPHMDESFS
jgi:hypothetical protein